VSLLGYDGAIEWKQTAEGLAVTLPSKQISPHSAALKIVGTNLKPVEIPVVVPVVKPDASGRIKLGPDDAELHGQQIKQENQGGQPNIGFWDKADEWVSWKIQFDKPGAFEVSASVAVLADNAAFAIEIAGQRLEGKPARTGAWDRFQDNALGRIEIKQAGEAVLSLRAKDASSWKAINLRSVSLKRADSSLK